MIQLNNLGEMRLHLPHTICTSVEAIVREAIGVQPGDSADDIPLAEVFGSPMFLVEIVQDLAAIRSFDEGPNGRLSILEVPSRWFDIARWEDGGNYAVFATIESADGGPQYFVPSALSARVPNIGASIALKNKAADES